MSGKFAAVDMHTQAIRHVVTLRGGPDNLGAGLRNPIFEMANSSQDLKDSSKQ